MSVDFCAPVLLADLVVLAEDAGEVAAGKEYGPRAAATDEGRFLTEMRSEACYAGVSPAAAEAHVSGGAVGSAAPGADVAGLKAGESGTGAILENLPGHLVVAGQEILLLGIL